MATQPLKLSPNDRVGDWVVEKELGSGGQGTVLKVRYAGDKHSPRAALKVCSDTSDKARARFQQELEILQAQSHPGIVRVRDSGLHLGFPFFVMELATTTLDKVGVGDTPGTRIVRESGHLLIRFLREACEALAFLHEKGVLHRDLKPSNVLLFLDPPEPMRAVLADFGIAAHVADQGQLTARHEVIGTPAYRAPESIIKGHTAASDVYAFGKIMEYVFARGPVTIGPGRCLRDSSFTQELWDHLDEVLAVACDFNPDRRYRTAKELLAALPNVALADVTRRRSGRGQRPGESTLSSQDCVTLAEVIGRCSASEAVSTYSLSQSSRLRDYQFQLSVKRLIALRFLETAELRDQHDVYEGLRPTAEGYAWAMEHQSQLDAALDQPSTSPEVLSESDIPF